MSETFLDGRVRVDQPQGGFRSGLDAVMLAAAIPALPGQAALELGAGAGTVSLCLAARVPHIAARADYPAVPPAVVVADPAGWHLAAVAEHPGQAVCRCLPEPFQPPEPPPI